MRIPLLEIKRLKAARKNDSVFISDTTSKSMALVANQTVRIRRPSKICYVSLNHILGTLGHSSQYSCL